MLYVISGQVKQEKNINYFFLSGLQVTIFFKTPILFFQKNITNKGFPDSDFKTVATGYKH